MVIHWKVLHVLFCFFLFLHTLYLAWRQLWNHIKLYNLYTLIYTFSILKLFYNSHLHLTHFFFKCQQNMLAVAHKSQMGEYINWWMNARKLNMYRTLLYGGKQQTFQDHMLPHYCTKIYMNVCYPCHMWIAFDMKWMCLSQKTYLKRRSQTVGTKQNISSERTFRILKILRYIWILGCMNNKQSNWMACSPCWIWCFLMGEVSLMTFWNHTRKQQQMQQCWEMNLWIECLLSGHCQEVIWYTYITPATEIF